MELAQGWPEWVEEKPQAPALANDFPDWAKDGGSASGRGEPGSDPETAIDDEPPDEDLPSRFGLKNFTANPAHMEREIQRRGFETKNLGDEDIRIRSKKDGRWYKLEKSGLDLTSLGGLKEAGRDIGDVLGGAVNLLGQGVGHVVGAATGALLGGPAAPATGFVGGVVGGGVGAGAADVARTEFGKRVLGYQPTMGEQAKSALTEGAYGTAGEILAPLAKPLIRGAGKLLQLPFKAETAATDWAGGVLDKIAARRVLGKKAGKVIPTMTPALDLAAKEVPELVTRDPAGKLLSETSRYIWEPTDPRTLTTASLQLNPTLARRLNKLFPGFAEAGKHWNEKARMVAVENAIAKLMAGGAPRTAAMAQINTKLAPMAKLFTRAYFRTMGPRGGPGSKIYGNLFRQLNRLVGPYAAYKFLTGGAAAGGTAIAATRGTALAGHVMEKGLLNLMGGIPPAPALRAARRVAERYLPRHYGVTQAALKNKDVRGWLEERMREGKEYVSRR